VKTFIAPLAERGVTPSRIGETLRATRVRAGWTREALAYHSGVSWPAIAQIESGRRREVRLSSLFALADALTVSVDYLIGTDAAMAPRLLEHRVLSYESDEEFLAGTTPFLGEGIERSDALLAVTTPARTGLLRDWLNGSAERVEFADSREWYRSPGEAMNGYRAFVKQKFEAGAAWVRIVGELVWTGRSDAEIIEWTRYESLLNLTFASMPTTILCPYDARVVPAQVLADAHRTHPAVTHGGGAIANPAYRKAEEFLLEPCAAR
jgi:transcriptional regulator with XRE-family HTH domain